MCISVYDQMRFTISLMFTYSTTMLLTAKSQDLARFLAANSGILTIYY